MKPLNAFFWQRASYSVCLCLPTWACSVTPQQENALRSIARQANSEIKKARQQFPDKNVDDICRSVLKKHRETVTLMGFTPTHLSLAIGMLNGVFKER